MDGTLGSTLGRLFGLGHLGRQLGYRDVKVVSQSDNDYQSPTLSDELSGPFTGPWFSHIYPRKQPSDGIAIPIKGKTTLNGFWAHAFKYKMVLC